MKIRITETELIKLIQRITEEETSSSNESCEGLKQKFMNKVSKITRNQRVLDSFRNAMDTNSADPIFALLKNNNKLTDEKKSKILSSVEKNIGEISLDKNNIDASIDKILNVVSKDVSNVKTNVFDKAKFTNKDNTKLPNTVNEQGPWDPYDVNAQFGEPIGWINTGTFGEVPIYELKKLKGWAKFFAFLWLAQETGLAALCSFLMVLYLWYRYVQEGYCR